MLNTKNKAGYAVTPVACGWAGAVIELTRHLGRSSELKKLKYAKKVTIGQKKNGTTCLDDFCYSEDSKP